jgi:hypothetical protein
MMSYIQAGWIAVGSTGRRVGDARLISVAVGRDNGQIMPVSCGYAGAHGDLIAVSVDVDVRCLGSTPTGHDGGAATGKALRKEGQP